MRLIHIVSLVGVLSSCGVVLAMSVPTETWQTAKSIYEFSATDIDGNEVSLDKYRDNVVIVVNVASK